MKTPIGIDKNTNEIRLIDDVESGLKCNCICPACKVPLVARKGKVKVHHFSHHKCSEQQACRETAIHLMAKYVIKEQSSLTFPERTFRSRIRKTLLGESIQDKSTHFSNLQSIYDCQEEVYLADFKIKPDILCKTEIAGESVEVAIEVVVTHKVDDDKLAKIKKAGLTTYEIDLADLANADTITFDDIKNALNERRRLNWTYLNPLIEERFNAQLQIKSDTKLAKRNSLITDWGNKARSYFLRKGSIGTPSYELPESVTNSTIRIIDGKSRRISLPTPPNLSQAYPINSVDDISKAVLTINIDHGRTTHSLPITINLPSTKVSVPAGSYLELKADKLPTPEEIESLLTWKKSVRIDRYIKQVKRIKEDKKNEFDTPIKAKVQKDMEWLRSIKRYEIQPVFPNLNRIHRDYIKAKEELTRKGFQVDVYTINLTDGWIFGCPNEYWQIILIRTICLIDNDSVDVKYYSKNLNEHHGISTIEPVRSLTFIPTTLQNMKYDTDDIPNTFKVLNQFFKHLESIGLLKWKWPRSYQKLIPFGAEYKAL